MAVLDDQHSDDTRYGYHVIEGRLHIGDGLDEIGGQCRRGIREGAVFGDYRGQIALAEAQRVAHFPRGRTDGNGGVGCLQRKGQPADLPRFTGIKTDDHGLDGSQIDVAPVVHDHLLGAGPESGLDGKLRHGAGDGSHRSDAHPVRGTGHPPRDFGGIGEDLTGSSEC